VKGIIRKRDVAFSAKDRNGREVFLLKSTIKNHVARFHFDEVLLVDSIKRELSNPIAVIENPGAKSEQAIYDIPSGGHKYLQVNVKRRWLLGKDLIVTFYGVDEIPKGRNLWKREK